MYALLSPMNGGLPSVISKNSMDYPTMIQAGYVELKSGSRKEMEEEYENIMEGMFSE